MADAEVPTEPETKLNVVGMIGLIVFYLIIFLAGILSHKLVISSSNKVKLLTPDFRKAGHWAKIQNFCSSGNEMSHVTIACCLVQYPSEYRLSVLCVLAEVLSNKLSKLISSVPRQRKLSIICASLASKVL